MPTSYHDLVVDDPSQPGIVGHYVQPPFSVWNRRSGDWQRRRKEWLAALPDDGVGRSAPSAPTSGFMSIGDGISRFDPVIAELFYRWWTLPGDRILDPFAGGPTRGAVAHLMGRPYRGVDVRAEQVAANRAAFRGPTWDIGDARTVADSADAVLTCPPYGALERYSDQPDDLSTLAPDEFKIELSRAIGNTVSQTRLDRYIGVVIGDARDRRGMSQCLPDVVRGALVKAGASVLQTVAIISPVGTRFYVGWRGLRASRTLQRVHQDLVIAVTGDPARAAERLRNPEGDVDE